VDASRAHDDLVMNATNGRSRPLSQIRVMRAMHPGVVACPPQASVTEVARLLATHAIHAVVVFRGGPNPETAWGLISALDLVTATTAEDADEQTAASIAVSPVVLVSTADTLERAAELMAEHATSHLVVLDADTWHPVGVLSTLDVAAALSGVELSSGPPRR
jgi:CBS domain-containing protein